MDEQSHGSTSVRDDKIPNLRASMIVRVGIPSVRNPRPKKTDETIDALKAYDKSKIDFQVFIVTGTHCVTVASNIASMANRKIPLLRFNKNFLMIIISVWMTIMHFLQK